MKKVVMTMVVFSLMTTVVNAQKTVIKSESFSDTQARMFELTAKSYVRPLVVDLIIANNGERILFNKDYPRTDVDIAMGGNLDNLRS